MWQRCPRPARSFSEALPMATQSESETAEQQLHAAGHRQVAADHHTKATHTRYQYVHVTRFFTGALAQGDAGAKARGEYNFYGRGARSAMQGARESAGTFREYVRSTQPAPVQSAQPAQIVREELGAVVVSPRIAQAATDEIGDYITKSEKHLAWMRRQAEARKDKETLASLDSIDRNIAAAKQSHATLCSCCLDDTVDVKATMACCQTIDDALGKAISEHDTLMKRLGAGQPSAK